MQAILRLMGTHRGHVRNFFECHRSLWGDQQLAIRAKRDAYSQTVIGLLQPGSAEGKFFHDPAVAALALCRALSVVGPPAVPRRPLILPMSSGRSCGAALPGRQRSRDGLRDVAPWLVDLRETAASCIHRCPQPPKLVGQVFPDYPRSIGPHLAELSAR